MAGVKEDIHIKVDKDLMRGVRAYAKSRGISLAAAVSVLVAIGLRDYRRALQEEDRS